MRVNTEITTLYVQWDPVRSPCDIDYIVEYRLVVLEACPKKTAHNVFHRNLSIDTSYSIQNLGYYSTYLVQVTARQNGVEMNSTTASTIATTPDRGVCFMYVLLWHYIHFNHAISFLTTSKHPKDSYSITVRSLDTMITLVQLRGVSTLNF